MSSNNGRNDISYANARQKPNSVAQNPSTDLVVLPITSTETVPAVSVTTSGQCCEVPSCSSCSSIERIPPQQFVGLKILLLRFAPTLGRSVPEVAVLAGFVIVTMACIVIHAVLERGFLLLKPCF